MANDLQRELLYQSLKVWAPTWPRRVNRTQAWADTPSQAVEELISAQIDEGNSPFISTYAFPRGHTKGGNIPQVDTLFIDFDFEDGDYVAGSGDIDAWRRDLSHLLVRVRRVAKYIQEDGAGGWRAALSGHKGIHLFLDFPQLPVEAGTFPQFLNGITEYADDLVDHIQEETGLGALHKYVDVTSGDLGRLCRVPNTLHGGATESFGVPRYCVPISIDELSELTVDGYMDYTSAPRPVSFDREPNEKVHEILVNYIQNASKNRGATRSGPSVLDWSRVDDYKEAANENITLDDIEFLTSDRPCVWRFYHRDDKYRHGYQSHYMEMFCIRELIEHNAPIDTILDFLDSAPEFDEEYSRQRIKEIIALDYNRFGMRKVLENAPEFCGYEDCSYCQSVLTKHEP